MAMAMAMAKTMSTRASETASTNGFICIYFWFGLGRRGWVVVVQVSFVRLQLTDRIVSHHLQINTGTEKFSNVIIVVLNHGWPLDRQPPRNHLHIFR
eukprot:m.257261 g.257261  ORF g.257261 m.257261 type:complete len:97 (+) comp35103_c0_seq1:1-291(+)